MKQMTLAEARGRLSQKEVSEALDIDRKTLSRWENGIGEPSVTQGRKLASLYGVALEDIIFYPKNQIKLEVSDD